MVAGSGNGWGKTQIIAAALAAVIWPKMAPLAFSQHPLLAEWPYPKRARINSTPKELETIGSLQVAIRDLFPKGKYEARRKGKSYDSEWTTDTGWTIDTFSYEQDAEEMAGPTLGLQIWNEPMPEDLWKEGQARLRRGGMNWVALTSLHSNPWVVDGILNKHNGTDWLVRYGDVCENCKEHGKNGHLEHSQIEKILAQYPDDEREARRTGRPLSLSGRIFKKFDRAVHVLPEVVRPPAGAQVYQAVDPAGGKPFAIIWAWVDDTGTLTIFDESPDYPFVGARDPGLNVQEYCDIFKTKEAGLVVKERIIDRRYANAQFKPGSKTLREDFADPHGIDFFDSYHVAEDIPEVQTGILKVSDYLAYDKKKPIDSTNRPRLLISPNCVNTIASLQNWSRNPKTLRPLDDHYKDFSDAVRYLVMAEPKVEQPREWVNPPKAHYGVTS